MREGPSNPFRGNPEIKLQDVQAMGAKPFEIQTNQVPEKVIIDLMRDSRLMQSLLAAGWPTDEKTCDRIGTDRGLGAESVAAVSKYQRALIAERDEAGGVN